MKILHLLYSGLGGHGNVFFSMLEADKEPIFEHEALFNGVEEPREEYMQLCNELGVTWNFVKKKRGLDIGFYKRLTRAIRKEKPQIIFLHGSTMIFPARLAILFNSTKPKIIVRETQANALKETQDWIWLSAAMLFADRVVFLSDDYCGEIRKKLPWLYRSKKVQVIPNGIDLQKFDLPAKQRNGIIIMGMQSRIVKIKDHETLLKAFLKLLKDPELTGTKLLLKIAGEGDYLQTLRQLAKELNIDQQVEFTGILNESALLDLLGSLDLYIHASLGETMSTAIMQAMACRRPVIASDVPGISNMITDGVNGILVPARDPQLMYEKMKWLIASPTEATRLSTNAADHATHHFSNEEMFSKYKAMILAM